uniref:Gustatory receptor n=1 Tax=Timema cristinae TaxID=61476 RepID=A0A7R9H3G0_TIMCR|nr:unnamed protein product [Timema cristinae]
MWVSTVDSLELPNAHRRLTNKSRSHKIRVTPADVHWREPFQDSYCQSIKPLYLLLRGLGSLPIQWTETGSRPHGLGVSAPGCEPRSPGISSRMAPWVFFSEGEIPQWSPGFWRDDIQEIFQCHFVQLRALPVLHWYPFFHPQVVVPWRCPSRTLCTVSLRSAWHQPLPPSGSGTPHQLDRGEERRKILQQLALFSEIVPESNEKLTGNTFEEIPYTWTHLKGSHHTLLAAILRGIGLRNPSTVEFQMTPCSRDVSVYWLVNLTRSTAVITWYLNCCALEKAADALMVQLLKVGVKFQETLLLIRMTTVDEETYQEIDAFLSTIEMCPPEVRLGEYVTLDRKVFVSIISRLVTYLVVLIQFQEEGSQENTSNSTSNNTTTGI